MWLLRRLPPEAAHAMALWGLRMGLWRVWSVVAALWRLAWATPLTTLKRRLEAREEAATAPLYRSGPR